MGTTAAPAGPTDRLPMFLRAPFEARTWRETLHVLLSFPIGVAGFCWVVSLLATGVSLSFTFVGLPLIAILLQTTRSVAAMERARAEALLHERVLPPRPFRPDRPGFLGWLRAALGDATGWRAALYFFLLLPVGTLGFAVAVYSWSFGVGYLLYPIWRPILFGLLPGEQPGMEIGEGVYLDTWPEVLAASLAGLVVFFLAPWLVRGVAQLDRALVRGLLAAASPSERVRDLEERRGHLVDTAAGDLRRIERDLHDGAQTRLVALAMDLGQARDKMDDDPEAAQRLVITAHEEAKLVLAEVRDLARGIYPAVLTDRGLDAALSSVAARCTVPVEVDVDLPERPPAAIERIAYFVACELLANVAKHSSASLAWLDIYQHDDRLVVEARDDGVGGVDLARGRGLRGLIDRVGDVDGSLGVDSPPDGPTTVHVELPLSSPAEA